MQHLTTLQKLSIRNCGELKSLPEELHKLTNLEELKIGGCSFLMKCEILEPLHTSGLHKLTSLRELVIYGCPALMSIPKGLLPTSLELFRIMDCPILESIHDGLSNLTSLKHLETYNCPMLTQEEWSKIAQIPSLLIQTPPRFGYPEELVPALANASPKQQRRILGESLYPLVEQLEHEMATKQVTEKLLEMEQAEVLHLLESPEALKAKVAEATEVLRTKV